MKIRVLSAALAAMILCGANVAMATGGHGGGGGGGGGSSGGGSASEKDGSPGPDRDAAGASSATEAALAQCERLRADRQIAQEGSSSGTIVTPQAGVDCDQPANARPN